MEYKIITYASETISNLDVKFWDVLPKDINPK